MPDSSFDQPSPAELHEVSRILAHAEGLVAAGDYRQAIDYATDANRHIRSAKLERQLVLWRASAFPTISHTGPSSWPPNFADPFPGEHGLPEIDAKELTAEIMGGAFQHHGSLWVHGLIPEDEAERLREGIEKAFAARDAHHAGAPIEDTSPWYVPIPLESQVVLARGWVEGGGGVWTADLPRMLSELIDLFDHKGLIDIITRFLGELPALSVGKSTLRRVPYTSSTEWHQDGAFLGATVRTVNTWLALSDCGQDAPGLDLVAQRLPTVVQPGSHGAAFNWSVGAGAVDVLEQAGAPVVSPLFKAGDAMLFDQLMLHRTGVRPGMTKSRWAIESWFFAPSTYPMEQGPLVV